MLGFTLDFSPKMVYIILQIIGVVILLGELFYVSLQKPSEYQKHLIVILLTLVISFIGYYVELVGMDYQTAYIGICIGYFGKPFALFASLLLLLEYANIRIPKWIVVSVLVFFVCLSTLVLTNEWHHLYYKSISFNLDNIGSPITIDVRGPFWYVYMASSFLIFGLYFTVAIYEFVRSRNKQAKQMAILLILVVFFSMLGLLAYILNITYAYDTTLFGILIGTIFLLILLTKYRLFDSLTLAQYKTFNESNDGVIILDARSSVTFYNKIAISLVPELETRGIKSEKVILDKLTSFVEGDPIFHNDRIYSLKISKTTSRMNNNPVGSSYSFIDITDHYNFSRRLEEDINSAKSKIYKIQRSALVSFADVVEARDGNTGEHVRNVANTAEKIAYSLTSLPRYKRLLDSEYIEILKDCAPLHDIGKIFISDQILLKPGKLTDEEREIMKTHTTMGKEIITKALSEIEEENYLKMASDIAYCHHEWFDGTGYPNGIKGTNIPLSARIMAVADVYDALRMKRPYKEPFSKEKSIDIIKEESGTHFDPEIVEAFIKVIDELN